MEYKVGDVVELQKTLQERWNPDVLIYEGGVVTIRALNRDGSFIFEENDGHWWLKAIDIVGLADEEKRAEMEEKKKKEAEEFKKRHKKLIYTPEAVEEIAVGIFGKDRVDVKNNGKDDFHVLIHFPVIEITNSRGQCHTIKDLVVRYECEIYLHNFDDRDNYKASVEFSGKRMSLSLREYESGYRHSHLQRSNYQFSGFCLGTSDYSMILSHLGMSLTEMAWTTTFLALENYLKWESLEGGPYMKIDEIKYNNRVADSRLNEEIKKFIKKIPSECWEFNDGVRLITAHPYLYDCINKHSEVRKLNSYTREEEEEKAKYGTQKCQEQRASFLDWKGEKWLMSVYMEERDEAGHIGRDLVEEYSNIILKEGGTYIKKYQYERKRQQYKEKVFGAIRA